MKQINNGYKEIYYLTKDGKVYDKQKDKTVSPNKKRQFTLITTDNIRKTISLKSLYRLVYGKEYCKDDIKDLDGELWRVIDQTDNIYWTSNKGRIKSLRGYNAIILKPYKTHNGYHRVDIIESGQRRSYLCHRLIAACWLPLPEKINYQLHHKDFNKNNNAPDNLEWLSPSEHQKKHNERSEKKSVCSEPKEDLHREDK